MFSSKELSKVWSNSSNDIGAFSSSNFKSSVNTSSLSKTFKVSSFSSSTTASSSLASSTFESSFTSSWLSSNLLVFSSLETSAFIILSIVCLKISSLISSNLLSLKNGINSSSGNITNLAAAFASLSSKPTFFKTLTTSSLVLLTSPLRDNWTNSINLFWFWIASLILIPSSLIESSHSKISFLFFSTSLVKSSIFLSLLLIWRGNLVFILSKSVSGSKAKFNTLIKSLNSSVLKLLKALESLRHWVSKLSTSVLISTIFLLSVSTTASFLAFFFSLFSFLSFKSTKIVDSSPIKLSNLSKIVNDVPLIIVSSMLTTPLFCKHYIKLNF